MSTVYDKPKPKDLFLTERICLQDERLSNAAKGLLVTMLSASDCNIYHIEAITSFCNDGEMDLIDQLKELVTYGYVVKFVIELYEFHDKPQIDKPLGINQVERMFNNNFSKSEFRSIYHQEEDLA